MQLKKHNYAISIIIISVFMLGAWKQKPIFKQNSFDFYVLSLSYSPTYCENNGLNARQTGQCRIGANYGLIVHGLWPQYEKGYPRECISPQKPPNAGLIAQMQDIMPSQKLVEIEWERHGTCSQMSAPEYFATLRKAYDKIKIPKIESNKNISVKKLETDFIKENYGLSKKGIAIISAKNKFSEVRICLTKQLEFRECDEVDKRAAKDFDDLYIPPKR